MTRELPVTVRYSDPTGQGFRGDTLTHAAGCKRPRGQARRRGRSHTFGIIQANRLTIFL